MNIRSFEGIYPRIAASAYVDPTAVVIGDVELGDEVYVLPQCVVRGDVNSIVVGARSNIQDGTVIHVNSDSPLQPGGSPLEIGEDVTIGHKVILHGCTIESHSLIGMGATVMDRAVVERDVIVGAGSLVAPGKRLAAGFLYTGTPARQVRELTAEELQGISLTALHYSELKYRHRGLEPPPDLARAGF